uniref:Secreted protein n=1 Tax=Salmo trutta TaxID=8032 RepID=A0A674C802_SALTR
MYAHRLSVFLFFSLWSGDRSAFRVASCPSSITGLARVQEASLSCHPTGVCVSNGMVSNTWKPCV